MDLKMVKTNQKRGNKQQVPTNNKTKKKLGAPLRVVYITNPIKFNATASEFRALVQELTGQDSDLPESDMFTAGGGGGGLAVDKVAASASASEEDYKDIHHLQDGVVDKMGHNREEGSQNGSGSLFGFGSGSYDENNNNNEDDDGFCCGGLDSFEEGLMMGSSSSFWINEGAHYLDDAFKR